ncbi:MAG: putative sulfate exporter family transporter [Lentisphaerae bacterium]|nr:putative sulfate exporter family transporter [Lentisphaerota bacterium]
MFKKLCFIIVAAAFFFVPWLWSPAGNWAPGLAVLTGILFSILWGNPFAQYTSKYTSNLLGATIVGMGFGMNLMDVLRAGGNGFICTFAGIAIGIGLGVTLGKIFRVSKNTAYLVSIGTSICGGSAIAAAAPVLKAKAHEIALASATVFLLNAVALWIFPVIGRALGFDQLQFGYWAALGIHDTSSVVGAAMAYGEEALATGTTVKLARALWIVPVTLFISCFAAEKTPGEKSTFKLRVPWFIPGFLIASALVTWLPQIMPAAAEYIGQSGKFIKNISKYLMIITLFFIGANLNKDKLKELGVRPVIQGIILWVVLAGVWCLAVYFRIVKCTN